jgi:hypothetical protein
MKSSKPLHCPFYYCIWTGLGVMNFALFLHPMYPMDFLALVFSDPLQTVNDSYGIQAVILFWIGASLVAFSLACVACCGKIFNRSVSLKMQSPQNPVNSNA